jgi:hypothetical protein
MYSQTLKVELSPDKSKVDRSVTNGTATIFFDSNVEDLSIVCTDQNPKEPIQKIGNKFWVMHVNPKKDIEMDDICYRNFLLKSPSSAEYYLATPEIGNNQVLYYTVVLPKSYPKVLSAEWIFNKSGKYGFRIAYGRRYGLLLGCSWGEYRPSGDNINRVTTDCDLIGAKLKGYIKTTVYGGMRMGLLSKKDIGMYLNLGLGYGEYGRQWENKNIVENSKYFYSDYIKGLNVNSSIGLNLFGTHLSFGIDMIMSKGKFVTEPQFGFGLAFNTGKWF